MCKEVKRMKFADVEIKVVNFSTEEIALVDGGIEGSAPAAE